MILLWILVIPLADNVLALSAGRLGALVSRVVSLVALSIDMALVLTLLPLLPRGKGVPGGTAWIAEVKAEWVPQLGITFHLGADGLSLLMVLLTVLLGLVSVACSWTEIRRSVGLFHFNLLWSLSGIMGVFLALDLFLFYCFWELMLIPVYFIIALWGHENRIGASVKFMIFTQLSSLFMLAAIIGLHVIHGRISGVYTFDYLELLGTPLTTEASRWLMSGFFIAFAVKLPALPFHSWLPDAHTEAPTAGSVILAGLLLKTGAYGLIRFMLPLFPDATAWISPLGMGLGAAGILYGAVLAFAQSDLKRLIAYSSVSHMGFVLLGVFAWNSVALSGALMQMLCHGISTGALFILAGALQERLGTRDLARMGGLWSSLPRTGGFTLLFALASLGLPGMGNFVGEILVLFGAYRVSAGAAIVSALGLVFGAVYSLWMIQRVFHGDRLAAESATDLSVRETLVVGFLAVVIFFLGLYPQPVFNAAELSLRSLTQSTSISQSESQHAKTFSGEGP